jgi:hemoglobin
MDKSGTPSLYEWAGGTPAFQSLINAFYDRVERDDLLGPLFPGGVTAEHRAHVTVWWIEVFGGPNDYTTGLGGYERMLAHHRDLGITAEHRAHVTVWWIEVFGGPNDYTTGLGGYERMLAHHRDLGISAEQRLRFVELMSRAADDAALPDDPEFRAALVGYLEWGTRLAMHNSQLGAETVPHAPVPRWGWGVAPPYQP